MEEPERKDYDEHELRADVHDNQSLREGQGKTVEGHEFIMYE